MTRKPVAPPGSAPASPMLGADAQLGWRPASSIFPQPSPAWKSWLLDPDSLTARLVAMSHGDFRVKVVEEGWSRHRTPSLLQCFDSHAVDQLMWSRKVVLIGKGVPWVTAHSLIPASSLKGPLKRICKLQDKPLGAFLFRHPQLSRRQFELARLDNSWGRRSLFYLFDKPLLVAEFFLPAIMHPANHAAAASRPRRQRIKRNDG